MIPVAVPCSYCKRHDMELGRLFELCAGRFLGVFLMRSRALLWCLALVLQGTSSSTRNPLCDAAFAAPRAISVLPRQGPLMLRGGEGDPNFDDHGDSRMGVPAAPREYAEEEEDLLLGTGGAAPRAAGPPLPHTLANKCNTDLIHRTEASDLTGPPVGDRDELIEQLSGLQRFDPAKAATWPRGSPTPLSFVAEHLVLVEERALSRSMSHKAHDTLCNLFRTILATTPSDLVPLTSLLLDQVLSAALAGVELIPSNVLLRAVTEASGLSSSSVKAACEAAGGDLASVARQVMSSQKRLFQPPPMSLAEAFKKIREIALLGGKEAHRRLDMTKGVLLAARDAEIAVVVRSFQSSLRKSGFSTSTIVSALARAITSDIRTASAAPILRKIAGGDSSGEGGGAGAVSFSAEEVEGLIHEALSQVPSFDKVVSTLLQHGPGGLLTALGVDGRRGAGTRGRRAKRLALQTLREDVEFDMAGSRDGWGHIGQQGAGDADLEELKEAAASARLSGLPPQSLTACEAMLLPASLALDKPRAIALRNQILLRHRRHVLSSADFQPLSEEAACAGVDPHNMDDARAVFRALTVLGFVNQPHSLISPLPLTTGITRKVVVIGAGFAGICSARQLSLQGFEVVTLEARDRIGGRVHGKQMGGGLVELGAMAITGSRGNPMVALASGAETYTLRGGCALYTKQGHPLSSKLDMTAEKTFNSLLDALPSRPCVTSQISVIAPPPVGKAPPEMLDEGAAAEQESHGLSDAQPADERRPGLEALRLVRDEEVEGGECEGSSELCGKFGVEGNAYTDSYANSWIQSLKGSKPSIRAAKVDALESWQACSDASQQNPPTVPPVIAEVHSVGGDAAEDGGIQCVGTVSSRGSAEVQEVQVEGLGDVLGKMVALEGERIEKGQSRVYPVSQHDLALAALQWHMANLEFAIGAPLRNVSSTLWNLDDPFLFTGDHWAVPLGIASLLEPLTQGLDVRLKHEVETIEYSSQGGVVVHTKGPGGDVVRLEADFCIVSVPLGVLKHGRPGFSPPLPSWKLRAIQGMGFGLLNKIALVFESCFWGDSYPDDYMGFLPVPDGERGFCYMFCNLRPTTNRPILLALMAGEAASLADKHPDKVLVDGAMAILRRTFCNASDPVETHVTRWGSDRYAMGAYSFMGKESKAHYHEALAREVEGRVFFAGEHTSRTHPAQVVGALLSGIHAAGRVAAFATALEQPQRHVPHRGSG